MKSVNHTNPVYMNINGVAIEFSPLSLIFCLELKKKQSHLTFEMYRL